MADDAAVVYGLEFQARVLTAQTAETEAIRFLVGTQSLKFDNQVHQIDFDDEQNLINKNVFLHREGEIWYISSSPADKNILATCYNKMFESKSRLRATLWRIPSEFDTSLSDETTSHAASLEMLCPLEDPEYETDTTCVLWHPANDVNKVISLTDNHILMWDIIDGQARISSTALLEAKGHPKFTNGKWNPHHNCIQIATANDTTIRGWDLRTMQQTYLIENAHSQLVRDLDFNPNKQYYLVSCGDDCKVRFWDVRNPSIPLKVLSDHSHWVWSVRYNHFHDQLVLTSSSDSRVILSNIVSISSEPFGHIIEADSDEDENGKESKEKMPLEDSVIATYEEHEDSVYAAEWSTADPWLFASLSYDGRLVINRVPRAEKYKILL